MKRTQILSSLSFCQDLYSSFVPDPHPDPEAAPDRWLEGRRDQRKVGADTVETGIFGVENMLPRESKASNLANFSSS